MSGARATLDAGSAPSLEAIPEDRIGERTALGVVRLMGGEVDRI